MQVLNRAEIPIEEHEKLCHKSLYEYLTKDNKPDEQRYYRTDEGELWEVSIFDGEKSEEFVQRMSALEYLQKKINLAESPGV